MIARFMDLEPEKRERIINAALEEFALKGYKNASTNEIVKKADIAKGLLFHYFKNKKGLFLFLWDYAWETFMNDFYCKVNLEERDIIVRTRQMMALEIEVIQRHPDLYKFIVNLMADDSPEIKKEIESKYSEMSQDGIQKLYSDIDTTKFKDGLDIRRVLDILVWIGMGLSNRELERMKKDPNYKEAYDITALTAEADEYIELFKNAFYK